MNLIKKKITKTHLIKNDATSHNETYLNLDSTSNTSMFGIYILSVLKE